MATRIKRTAEDLYDEDFYVWAQGQAELLRERRFDELDLANLIEEVEDLAGAMRRSVPESDDHHHGASAQSFSTRLPPIRAWAGVRLSEPSVPGL